MRAFCVCLVAVIGAGLVFTAGAGLAAGGYLAFDWVSTWVKRPDDYKSGYAAAVVDTLGYVHQMGLSGANLNSIVACAGQKGLTNGAIAKAVDAQLASNPNFAETIAAEVMMIMESCKLNFQAGTMGNPANMMRMGR